LHHDAKVRRLSEKMGGGVCAGGRYEGDNTSSVGTVLEPPLVAVPIASVDRRARGGVSQTFEQSKASVASDEDPNVALEEQNAPAMVVDEKSAKFISIYVLYCAFKNRRYPL